ncbi:MAG: hypothetical protein QME25_01980 [Bacteroidota bacterium]|nr:hypothetical protein [Bacteroidota bacterium]
MSRFEIKLITSVILFILAVLTTKLVMTIETISVNSNPATLYPDGTSTVTVNVVGLNRFGFAVPFKKPEVKYIVSEGKEKVTVVASRSSQLILKARFETGIVVIIIKNKYTVLPIKIEIPIVTPLA